MRSIFKRISLLAAALMIVAVPALADEGSMDSRIGQGQQNVKDECLLVAKNCGDQLDTIQERINRINGEISRGTDVYTNEELRTLERQLDDAHKTLEELSAGG
jgi:TolA-binding protein